MLQRLTTGLFILALLMESAVAENITRSHALTIFGAPKYPADFTHFDYVNPSAPKGGRMDEAAVGTFDSFNPWIDKGTPVGLSVWADRRSRVSLGVMESLMTPAMDEIDTRYCLLCQWVEYPEDKSWLRVKLRDSATWHDGQPISAADVAWTLQTLREQGAPSYKFIYQDIGNVTVESKRVLRFDFLAREDGSTDRELPLLVGDMPVLPKHYWQQRDFSKTTLEPPLGSGPYRIADFEAGRFVAVERVANYWGSDLAVNQGLYNFAAMRYDYYRDNVPVRLALLAGDVDFYSEYTAKSWASDYDTAAVRDGWLVKERIDHQKPQAMQAFVFNLRQPKFADPRVRRAIAMAFNFLWTNERLFYSQYQRLESYFANTPMLASGLPAGEELALLQEYKDTLPAALFKEEFSLDNGEQSGWMREQLLSAQDLLKSAGWVIKNGRLVDQQGQPMEIEFLLYNAGFERVLLPFAASLQRLGITLKVRLMDISQYLNRARAFDFDMIISVWSQSRTPGIEQREYWGCEAANRNGSRNLAGICQPAIDGLIDQVLAADSREQLTQRVRALDRALLWGHYVIPNWYLAANRVLWWNKYSRPAVAMQNGVYPLRWWFDEEKAQRLAAFDPQKSHASQPSDELANTPSRGGWFIVLLVVMGVFLAWMMWRYRRKPR